MKRVIATTMAENVATKSFEMHHFLWPELSEDGELLLEDSVRRILSALLEKSCSSLST